MLKESLKIDLMSNDYETEVQSFVGTMLTKDKLLIAFKSKQVNIIKDGK